MSNLKNIRQSKGWTQQELSNHSNVSINMIVKYENGQRDIDGAGLDILTKLAIALNVKIIDILEDEKLINNAVKCL